MADLAELGIRISSEEAAVADQRLDAFSASADRAENAAIGLAGGARTASTAVATMNAAVRQQDMVLRAQQVAMRQSTLEGLNLTRQFSDIGVSAAMGMNPLMILIQQGPQIADIFQQAAAEGRNFRTVMDGILARLAPLLIPLGLVAAAVGSVAAGFALLHREVGKGYPDDITKGMDLTEEQLDRVKSKTVTFGDTFMATFSVIGKHIMDGPIGVALGWLGDKVGEVLDWISKMWVEGWALQIGVAVGAYRTIVESWRSFPAAMGEIMTDGANAALRVVESLINGTIGRINGFIEMANNIPGVAISKLGNVDLPELEQRFAGSTAAIGASLQANVSEEVDRARSGIQALGREIQAEALRRAQARAREEAGKPNKGREGKSEAEKLQDEIERYIQSLKDQAATLGMNAIATKQYEIAQRALKAVQIGLNDEVETAGRLLIDKMKAEVASTRITDEALAVIQLETRLIAAGNVERAVAIARLQKMQELERGGVKAGDPGYASAVEAAGRLATAQERLRVGQDRFNDSLRLTLDLARQSDDIMRDAANGFADAFGDAGDAIGGVLSRMTDLNSRMADIQEQRAEMARRGTLTAQREAMFERDRASATIGAYGDMLSAARGYFAEGSDGYRALMAVEQVYRAFQLASAIQAMALGGQETAFTLGQNALRAASHGVVAVARAIASLPFPMNLVAGAATIAALAAIGVKIAGGGGGGSRGSSEEGADHSTNAVRSYSAQDAQARDQAASSIASKVEIRVSADRDGLNAYVARTAQQEAFGVAAPMVAAAAAGTKRDVMQSLNDRQVGNRKISI